MSIINLLTTLLVKAYRAEAAKHQKHADKAQRNRLAFKEEAEEFLRRSEDADLAAAESLSAEMHHLVMRSRYEGKSSEVERFFGVTE